MKKSIFLLLFALVSFSFSQSSEIKNDNNDKVQKEKRDNLPKYKIKIKFPLEVYHVYRMTESSQISRTFSDNNVSEFTRDVNYFFTLRMTTNPNDGFQKVEVIIDSMDYDFKQGKKEIKSGSQSDNDIPLNNKDFLNYLVPVSKEFTLTYSPYNDVAKIEGDRLLEFRKEYSDPEKGIKDSLGKSIFINRMSDKDLKFITDLTKNILPISEVNTDTIWKSPFYFDIAGLRFNGNISTKIKGLQKTTYLLESITDTLKIENKTKYYEDINQDVVIENGKSVGSYSLDASSDGSLTYAKAVFVSELNCKVNKVTFKEIIKTKTVWDLLERFHY
jgi:hypothetical protein